MTAEKQMKSHPSKCNVNQTKDKIKIQCDAITSFIIHQPTFWKSWHRYNRTTPWLPTTPFAKCRYQGAHARNFVFLVNSYWAYNILQVCPFPYLDFGTFLYILQNASFKLKPGQKHPGLNMTSTRLAKFSKVQQFWQIWGLRIVLDKEKRPRLNCWHRYWSTPLTNTLRMYSGRKRL